VRLKVIKVGVCETYSEKARGLGTGKRKLVWLRMAEPPGLEFILAGALGHVAQIKLGSSLVELSGPMGGFSNA